jgi:hypothetical protein
MKNNILTLILCLGSLALGFVLNSYWKLGDVLLQTEKAHQELADAYSGSRVSCRALEYGVNNIDIRLYQRALSFLLNPEQDSEKHVINVLWWRYSDLVKDSNHRNSVLNNQEDELQGNKASTVALLQEANAFVSKNQEYFEALDSELWPNNGP